MSAVPMPRVDMLPVPWRRALAITGVLLAALLALYRDTALAMVLIWARSDTFAHGFLVLPIVAWLIWRRRADLLAQEPGPTGWALIPAALAAALWLMAEAALVDVAAQFALVALLVSVVGAMLGPRATKTIAFPLAFLFFAVPFGEFLTPWLMERTADFTVAALRLAGVPVYREGFRMVLPSGVWSIVEACSGIRYLMASVMVGTLYAYLRYRSLRRRLIFLGVSFAVPIAANWVRAFMVVMLGHLSDNRLAVGVDHIVYGWLFFGVVILMMFAIGARWDESHVSHSTSPALAASTLPVSDARVRPASWAVPLAAVCLLSVPHITLEYVGRANVEEEAPALSLSAPASARWRPTEAAFTNWSPSFKQPSAQSREVYSDGARSVGLYLAYYRQQGPDRKLVSTENVLGDSEWINAADRAMAVQVGGSSVPVRQVQLKAVHPTPPVTGLTLWHFYWVDGTFVANEAQAKLHAALQRLRGDGDDSAAVVLFVPTGEGDTAALNDFLRDMLEALRAQLTATGGDRGGRGHVGQPRPTRPAG